MMKITLKAASEEEKNILCEAMEETKKELDEQIRKETGCPSYVLEKKYEDEKIVQGIFKTYNEKIGTFSFSKTIVPSLVVNVY